MLGAAAIEQHFHIVEYPSRACFKVHHPRSGLIGHCESIINVPQLPHEHAALV